MALLSMFVAHAAPGGPVVGPLGTLTDFLTAALFAMLVGVGPSLRSGAAGRVPSVVRGLMLVVVGLLLEQTGAQVVVILVHLGVLTWVVALLRLLPSWALAGAAALLAFFRRRCARVCSMSTSTS